jgi:hypothetical protein
MNLLYSVINGLRTTVTVLSNSMNSLENFSCVFSMTYTVLFMFRVKSKLLFLLKIVCSVLLFNISELGREIQVIQYRLRENNWQFSSGNG